MRFLFIKEFLNNPRTIGAITFSSKYLAKNIANHIDFKKCHCIVEYGAGTGVFTSEIIKRKRKDTVFVVIELNNSLYKILKDRFKNIENVHIINDDVKNLQKILKKLNIQKVDHIISGLPFTSLPKEIGHAILSETKKCLSDTGFFTTFQYSLIKKNFFENHFRIINVAKENKNFPPAYVLNLKK